MSTATSKSVASAAADSGVSWKFWVGLLVLIGATGFVVTSSMSSTVHYYNVNEVTGNAPFVGESMRLRGIVVAGSHRVRSGTLDEHVFLIGLEQESVTVLYKGALPDQFQDGASVIATGVLVDGETFEADSITAQCPSRYENAAPTAPQNHEALGGGTPTMNGPASPSRVEAPAGPYGARPETETSNE